MGYTTGELAQHPELLRLGDDGALALGVAAGGDVPEGDQEPQQSIGFGERCARVLYWAGRSITPRESGFGRRCSGPTEQRGFQCTEPRGPVALAPGRRVHDGMEEPP